MRAPAPAMPDRASAAVVSDAHGPATSDSATMPSSSASPTMSLSAWLRVAFWKKPLHLLATDELAHHGGGSVQDGAPREIERTLGLFDLIMIGIGGTVGSGVFATAGLIANVYAGPAAILSWLIAGIGCILSGFSFMELSCLIPSTGSTYAYAYHALGELPAMFAGFLLTLEYGVSSAGGARSWSDKLTNWLETEWQITGPEWMKPKDSTVDLYAGLLMATCMFIVLGGMQAGKVLVNVVTMTKISVVLFIIVFGFMHFDVENITPLVPEQTTNTAGQVTYGWPGVFLGASASFFGYIGYDEVCCLAGEAKNPTHTIPRAVIGTIVGAALLSTLATFSLVGMQRYTEIDTGESYGKAFEHVGWSWAATIVSTGEVFTMPITTFIGFLAQPRVQYAMAKDGLLPGIFARVDSNGNLFHGTLICGLCVMMIAIFVPFKILWDFISLGILVAFNLTNASLLLVRASRLRDGANGNERASMHSYLIVGFLVTSFLAAYHWQKSIITPPPPPSELDDAVATYSQRYMRSFGPHVASVCSVFAIAAMCALKYVESTAEPAVNHGTKATNSKSHKTTKRGLFSRRKLSEEVPMRRVRMASDEEDSDDVERDGDALERGDDDTDTVTTITSTEDDLTDDSDDVSKGLKDVPINEDDANDVGVEDDDDNNGKSRTFQAPLVPFTPCVAIFFNWFLFAQMDASSVGLIVLWLLLALAVYVSYSLHHSLGHHQLTYRRVSQ
ncbi:hypothetical protein Poli38472_012508 [Pythium oligandrum]|uniref:Cationic amino acid transporter C-terminal domain-containing protein n=1 Tax=Pythium oligandrum TaxID=41045 RepID=A0A8K1CFN8_PYTOL|nr:hypothetical protein Poli38472_012508 [Pythium oligandrum]|eukprot:TMW61317.1 hypothetical protein Poli38472_012508 [Pythium oligandrum]